MSGRRCFRRLQNRQNDDGEPALTPVARRAVCRIKPLLLFLRTMRSYAENLSRMRHRRKSNRRLGYVNVFLAGILGLILPFVCWGAEATPGHTHLRAHFVFIAPIASTGQAFAAYPNAQAAVLAAARSMADGLHELCTAPVKSAATNSPSGQSTPQTLAVTLLLIVVLGAVVALHRHHPGGFPERFSAIFLFWLPLDVATPPPRPFPLF